MSNVTQILRSMQEGDPQAGEDLFPLVYQELRLLAARKMACERPDQTLSTTSLVHEAFLRLIDVPERQDWENRRHFFAAAAEAMRRILTESARRRQRQKHGGQLVRQDIHPIDLPAPGKESQVLEIHDVLDGLEAANRDAAEIVKLRYFAGFTNQEAADILGVSPRKANQLWGYARAWLLDALGET